MANHDAIKTGDCYGPTGPPPEPPTPQAEHENCEGTIEGQIKLHCHTHCLRLKSHTMVLVLGPQSEADLVTLIQGTAQAYEASGYVVLAHNLADTGAGWVLGLTIGYYA